MQDIPQHWQTWLTAWMVLGNAWLICLVAASSSFSQGEKWSISGILLLGPFGPLIYLGSYLWVLVKRKPRK